METDMAWSEFWELALAAVKKHWPEGSLSAEKAMRLACEAGDYPPIYDDTPEAGYYKVRVAPRQDIWLPVRMYYVLRCEVGRYHTSPYTEWLHCCKFPISRKEWEDLKGIKSTLTHGGKHARV